MAVSCMYCERLPIDGDVTEYISQNIDRIAEKVDYLKIVFAPAPKACSDHIHRQCAKPLAQMDMVAFFSVQPQAD